MAGSGALCCARHFLASQEDFKNQKSALQEATEHAGHIFELYPKYHCECNWIERYWGSAKRIARLNCDYTFKSLENNVGAFLDEAGNIEHIRRSFRRCMEYIEAYSMQKNGEEVALDLKKFVNKTFQSHRRIGRFD